MADNIVPADFILVHEAGSNDEIYLRVGAILSFRVPGSDHSGATGAVLLLQTGKIIETMEDLGQILEMVGGLNLRRRTEW